MKQKILGLTMGLLVSVMSFMPAMTVNAYFYEDICGNCGEYSSANTVIGTKLEYVMTVPCTHYEYTLSFDSYYGVYDEVEFYCADCDMYWVEYMQSGTYVECHHPEVAN